MKRPEGKVWLKSSGGVPEIIGVISEVDKSLSGDTKEIARKYPANKRGLNDFFDFVVREIKYKRDGKEAEVIKYPTKTLREKTGDCKSLSILIGSFLKDKGIPYFYRFTYTDKNNPLNWHVYPIAILGAEHIKMDAVIKRFNEEHPYIKKFDYYPKNIMAVSGVGAGTLNPAMAVPPKNYIDTFNMTSGEITGILLYEQANIISSQEPENKEVASDRGKVKDALFLGLNGKGIEAIKSIKNAQLRSALIRAHKENKSISGLRNNGAGISDPLIPMEDCSIYLNSAYGQNNPQEYARCENHNRYKRMLNEHLEGSAHHLLYEYQENPNLATPTVAAKKVLHEGAVGALANITGISRQNIRLWLRNGVLRENAKRGIGALQPEQTIPALAEAERQGISGLPVPVILAIIAAISSAIAGTLQLIAGLKAAEQERLRFAAQTIGQKNFGPLASDWQMGGQNGGQDIQEENGGENNIIPIVAAAAGLYLITKK